MKKSLGLYVSKVVLTVFLIVRAFFILHDGASRWWRRKRVSLIAVSFSILLVMAGGVFYAATASGAGGWSIPASSYSSDSIHSDLALLQLTDGRMLKLYWKYSEATGYHIAYQLSEDGVNWTSELWIPGTAGGGDPTAVQLPSGKVMVAFAYYTGNLTTSQTIRSVQTTIPVNYETAPITIDLDDWGSVAEVVPYESTYSCPNFQPNQLSVPFVPNLALLGDGSKVMLSYGWGKEYAWATNPCTGTNIQPWASVRAKIYDVNANTWGAAGTIHSDNMYLANGYYSSDPSVVKIDDDEAIAVFFKGPRNISGYDDLRDLGDRNVLALHLTTSDGWFTWNFADPAPVTVYAGARADFWPYVIRLNDGQLMTAFTTADGTNFNINPANSNIELVTSSDNGYNWSPATMIGNSSQKESFPALVQRPNGQVMAVWNGDGSTWNGPSPNWSYTWQSYLSAARLSTTASGVEGNNHSDSTPSSTADSRYVVFSSLATNLRPDNNNQADIFRKDTVTGDILLLSNKWENNVYTESDGANSDPHISPNGRYLAWSSLATNLVSGDTNGRADVFVKDMQTWTTTRVSTSSSGAQVFDGDSQMPVVSDNGRVAFRSTSSNLVIGDTNNVADVFVKDIVTGATTRVSVSTAGNQGDNSSGGSYYKPAITPDGRYVVFDSVASNLVTDDPSTPSVNESDTNGVSDIFIRDTVAVPATTTRVSTSSTGEQASGGGSFNPSISSDGRFVAFRSEATNLVSGDTNGQSDIFVKDMLTGQLTRVSTYATGAQATTGSWNPAISADGNLVSFASAANLTPGDSNGIFDVFVKNRATGAIVLASKGPGNAPGDNMSLFSSLSSAGKRVAFNSLASNLVGDDTNGKWDIFLASTGY